MTESSPIDELSKSQDRPTHAYALAETYLDERNYISEGKMKLRYWQSIYYLYTGKRYEPLHESELKSDIVRWLQDQPDVRSKINGALVTNIILNINGRSLISHETPLNSWLNLVRDGQFVPLQNGILDLRGFIHAEENIFFVPHTPDFFSTNCLPFSFDPKANSPTWQRILNQIQPDKNVQMLLQEWIGYNLIADLTQQKFMVFLGEGANGKGVVFAVFLAMLGKENVSSVSLEAFNPSRTFPLAATIGKLANLCAEIGEVGKPSEGLLKQFVGGDFILIEQKHKPAYSVRPTARLTFSTNILPRFTDRSSGIWRRLLLMPFLVQIPEEQQDRRLTEVAYWVQSGELPGVFNWALAGLIRLLDRGRFDIPELCQAKAKEYRSQCNPVKEFLVDGYHENVDSIMPSTELYQDYRGNAHSSGLHPLGLPQFAEEVRRTFPSVKKTENAISLPKGGRGHAWIGLVRKW